MKQFDYSVPDSGALWIRISGARLAKRHSLAEKVLTIAQKNMPLSSALRQFFALAFLLMAAPFSAFSQFAFAPQGGEYPIVGTIPGDQTSPSVSINSKGGYVVWQDNASDEDGLGISARRLNQNLAGTFAPFRVNQRGAGDQESPQVVHLKNGGAVIVWRSAKTNIMARFLKEDGTFLTDEIVVNTDIASIKLTPAVASLINGNAAVVWASDGQDGSMQGIYGQVLSPTGQKLGVEFNVNITTLYNQRTPAVVGLTSGGFAVTWISESGVTPTGDANLDVFARMCGANGPLIRSGEFKVNDVKAICANPSVSEASDGAVLIAWSQRKRPVVSGNGTITPDGTLGQAITQDQGPGTDSWDIAARAFTETGVARKPSFRVNSYVYGAQYAPKISALGAEFIIVWTSLAQDGSQEGVYGQYLDSDSNLVGNEFRVNTTTASKQIHPTVAADGNSRFLAVWTSFVGGVGSFDLFAQRYALTTLPLLAPSTPFVSALNQSHLSVAWPELAGLNIANYSLYVDGAADPIILTSNYYVITHLSPKSTHTVKLKYSLADGQTSPLSLEAMGTTWDEDANGDGLPDDWQQKFWGMDSSAWPSATADSDGDGATNLQEFLAGTDPTDAKSLLRTTLTSSTQGNRLNWNTMSGFVYQVQTSADLSAWANVGSPRFATGATDSMLVAVNGQKSYFRVIRLR